MTNIRECPSNIGGDERYAQIHEVSAMVNRCHKAVSIPLTGELLETLPDETISSFCITEGNKNIYVEKSALQGATKAIGTWANAFSQISCGGQQSSEANYRDAARALFSAANDEDKNTGDLRLDYETLGLTSRDVEPYLKTPPLRINYDKYDPLDWQLATTPISSFTIAQMRALMGDKANHIFQSSGRPDSYYVLKDKIVLARLVDKLNEVRNHLRQSGTLSSLEQSKKLDIIINVISSLRDTPNQNVPILWGLIRVSPDFYEVYKTVGSFFVLGPPILGLGGLLWWLIRGGPKGGGGGGIGDAMRRIEKLERRIREMEARLPKKEALKPARSDRTIYQEYSRPRVNWGACLAAPGFLALTVLEGAATLASGACTVGGAATGVGTPIAVGCGAGTTWAAGATVASGAATMLSTQQCLWSIFRK